MMKSTQWNYHNVLHDFMTLADYSNGVRAFEKLTEERKQNKLSNIKFYFL